MKMRILPVFLLLLACGWPSPARADSIAAFSARRFVWSAMSFITLMMEPI